MSPQAIANPEDLERFARDLTLFNTMLRDSLGQLNGEFMRLSETWRDQEHRKFAEEYEVTVRTLHHFMAVAEEHIPFLIRKAQRIHDYLQQR